MILEYYVIIYSYDIVMVDAYCVIINRSTWAASQEKGPNANFCWKILDEFSRNWNRKSLGRIPLQNWEIACWMWDIPPGCPRMKGKTATVKQMVLGENKADFHKLTTDRNLNASAYMSCNIFLLRQLIRPALLSSSRKWDIAHRNFDRSFLSVWPGSIRSFFSWPTSICRHKKE